MLSVLDSSGAGLELRDQWVCQFGPTAQEDHIEDKSGGGLWNAGSVQILEGQKAGNKRSTMFGLQICRSILV